MAKSDVERVRRDMFGGTLATQGRGFYVTLEFLAVVKGVAELHELEGSDADVLTRDGEKLRYLRRGHDIARRLAHQRMSGLDGRRPAEERLAAVAPSVDGGVDTMVIDWIGSLFAELTVPRPYSRGVPDWGGLYLYPYVGEMIHYDAFYRRQNVDLDYVSIERYSYRGGGALAYEIVRADPDPFRRESIATELDALVSDSGSPLGRIASALAAHEPVAADSTPSVFEDPSADYRPDVHETQAAELLRSGLHRLLSAPLPRPKAMELLMHWLPFTLARHQVEVATAGGGDPKLGRIPVEFIHGASPLRRLARTAFDKRRRGIAAAVTERLLEAGENEATSKSGGEESAKFYSSTLATIGHLNANSGLRHYVIRNSLLEAIVFALVPADAGMDFDAFCNEVLGQQLDFIVGERSPGADKLLGHVDNGLLRANQAMLQDRLAEIGLLENLSDATKRVEARS